MAPVPLHNTTFSRLSQNRNKASDQSHKHILFYFLPGTSGHDPAGQALPFVVESKVVSLHSRLGTYVWVGVFVVFFGWFGLHVFWGRYLIFCLISLAVSKRDLSKTKKQRKTETNKNNRKKCCGFLPIIAPCGRERKSARQMVLRSWICYESPR